MSSLINRCRGCGQEYSLDTTECEVCYRDLSPWCAEHKTWAGAEGCEACAERVRLLIENQERLRKIEALRTKLRGSCAAGDLERALEAARRIHEVSGKDTGLVTSLQRAHEALQRLEALLPRFDPGNPVTRRSGMDLISETQRCFAAAKLNLAKVEQISALFTAKCADRARRQERIEKIRKILPLALLIPGVLFVGIGFFFVIPILLYAGLGTAVLGGVAFLAGPGRTRLAFILIPGFLGVLLLFVSYILLTSSAADQVVFGGFTLLSLGGIGPLFQVDWTWKNRLTLVIVAGLIVGVAGWATTFEPIIFFALPLLAIGAIGLVSLRISEFSAAGGWTHVAASLSAGEGKKFKDKSDEGAPALSAKEQLEKSHNTFYVTMFIVWLVGTAIGAALLTQAVHSFGVAALIAGCGMGIVTWIIVHHTVGNECSSCGQWRAVVSQGRVETDRDGYYKTVTRTDTHRNSRGEVIGTSDRDEQVHVTRVAYREFYKCKFCNLESYRDYIQEYVD